MPGPPAGPSSGWRPAWERWQDGLTIRPTLLSELPPLRMLLVLDKLAGHKTPELVCWLLAHDVMPLHTPISPCRTGLVFISTDAAFGEHLGGDMGKTHRW